MSVKTLLRFLFCFWICVAVKSDRSVRAIPQPTEALTKETKLIQISGNGMVAVITGDHLLAVECQLPKLDVTRLIQAWKCPP